MSKRPRSPKAKLAVVADAPVTIQCIWRPASEDPDGYKPESDRWHRGDESALGTEMRLWGSAERYAFCRLREGTSRNELKPHLQETFGINSRYSDDAIVHAKAIISSQRELVPIEIEETEAKLTKANKKQKADRAKVAKLTKVGNVSEARRAQAIVAGRAQRVKKLEKKLAKYRDHQEKGDHPDGGLRGEETLAQGLSRPGEQGRVEGCEARPALLTRGHDQVLQPPHESWHRR